MQAENDKKRGRLVFFPSSKASNQSTDIYSSESSCEQITSGSSLTGITCSSSSGLELNVKSEIVPANKEPSHEVPDLSVNHLLDKPSLEAKPVESPLTSKSTSPSSFSLESEETVEAADRDEPVHVDSIELAFSPRESQEIPVDSIPITVAACSLEESQNVGTESGEANFEPAVKKNVADVMPQREQHPSNELEKGNSNVISIENQIRVQYLQNDLQSSRDNADYWFKESVVRREKIEELLVQMRTVSSSNYDLRQEINSMSGIIHDKDEELQRLIDSNAQNEKLLRELRQKLSDATKENCRLQSLLRENDENKQQHSLMVGGIGEQKPSTSFGKRLRGSTQQRQVSDGAPTDHASSQAKADSETPCCSADTASLEEFSSREALLGLGTSSREPKSLTTPCQERSLEGIANHQAEIGVVDTEVKVENETDSPTPDVVLSSSCDLTLMNVDDAGESIPTGKNANVKQWLNDLFHRAKSELAHDWMKICCPEETEETLGNLVHDRSEKKVITADEEKKSEKFTDGRSSLEERSASDGHPCPSSSRDGVEEFAESVPLPNPRHDIIIKSLDGVFAQLPLKSQAAGIPDFKGCNIDAVLTDTKPANFLSKEILGPAEPFGEVHTPWLDPTTTRKAVAPLNADEMEQFALMELTEQTSSEEQQPDVSDAVPASEMATDELFGTTPIKSDSFSSTGT